ncbi:UDP-glucose/GDP-mannose dehydrogenase family protein [Rossellomorea aquimaris]|uniref:UDP-glucose dehydrogenase family protein n=1 Tax=Rossellomorea TaxID=2837508 RepID=UPI001CD62310|nr:UDP-glucose/GDP-mannose dehydrogenase family protein [Rossellomorea aquimaris]MCA1060263.1 UDP-glucose/GDP-mannose dehydrogenase family protein [Rossellomorea aquimaris]
MKIAIIGTGYVGLVTGVCLSEIGHEVTCIDINPEKVDQLKKGISPIYEPGLEELMEKNREAGRLDFTTNYIIGLKDKEAVYIAVGTPQSEDGAADLTYVFNAARSIGQNITRDVVVVTKSTVPIGTNAKVRQLVMANLQDNVCAEVVSNPEFLREGSAIEDSFNGDRIVIGSDHEGAGDIVAEINEPFGIPILRTSLHSAEMIKYAANAFLATKISFINEIANLSERTNANIEEVARGIGMDTRIGNKFLNAGIGYGGSCFPKDTQALVKISEERDYDFHLLKSVINVNEKQKTSLVRKAKERFGTLHGKKIALLGLAFKPETDDMREAASISVARELIEEGAEVIGYDPIATENAKKVLPEEVQYVDQIEEAIKQAEVVFILTEWKEIVEKTLIFSNLFMETPIVFDGRNCYSNEDLANLEIEYISMGRDQVTNVQERRVAAAI